MSILLAALIVVVVAALAIAAMLFVRRGAPEGSYFADGDRAVGRVRRARHHVRDPRRLRRLPGLRELRHVADGAETEARVIAQQFEIVQFLPAPAAKALTGELGCYARNVVHEEWPEMADGHPPNANPWGVALFRTLRPPIPARPPSRRPTRSTSTSARTRRWHEQDRVHGAEGVIPTPLWIVLGLSATILFVYMLFFADSGEGRVTQAMLMGSVAVVVTSLLLLLWFLDNPFHGGVGSLKPVAMERTLALLEQQAPVVGGVDVPLRRIGRRAWLTAVAPR